MIREYFFTLQDHQRLYSRNDHCYAVAQNVIDDLKKGEMVSVYNKKAKKDVTKYYLSGLLSHAYMLNDKELIKIILEYKI